MGTSSFGKKTKAPGYVPGDHWVECQRTGMLIRASDARKEWTGLIVSKDEWEPRHPQDFLKGRSEDTSAKGLVNPENTQTLSPPTGTVGTYYPNVYGQNSKTKASISGLSMSDSQVYTLSFWFWVPTVESAQSEFFWVGNGTYGLRALFSLSFPSFNFTNENTDSVISIQGAAVPSNSVVAKKWNHILISYNAATGTAQTYLNGTQIDLSFISTYGTGTLDWSSQTTAAFLNTAYDIAISEFFFSIEDYNNSTTLNSFIVDGKPADLGNDGSNTWSENTPLFYFPDGNFSNNRGSGGNFTITEDAGNYEVVRMPGPMFPELAADFFRLTNTVS